MNLDSNKKWIVFDAMGVVFKVGDDTGRLLIPMLRELVPSLTIEEIHDVYIEASLGEITALEFWRRLGFEKDYPQIQRSYLDQYLTLAPQFKSVAQELSKSYKLAMLSNDVAEWSEYLRKKHGLDEYFDEAVISSQVGCRKPSKEIYEILLKRICAEPGDCLFIDDRDANLKAAAQLGINTVLFNRDKIVRYDGFIINSFTELKKVVQKVFQ